MKVLLISDIHANLAALNAVIGDAESSDPIDSIWVMGDTVGYGPDPNECLALIRDAGAVAVAGNHEQAAVGMIDTRDFNPVAAAAAEWTARQLTDESREYINSLPLRTLVDDFTLTHGSPRDPTWEYLLTTDAALANLRHFETRGCVIGHSHLPFLMRMIPGKPEARLVPKPGTLEIGPHRSYANPGSVGQPRDGDPRASYAVLDTAAMTLEFRRVAYDIEETQKRMMAAGLPKPLVVRLSHGR